MTAWQITSDSAHLVSGPINCWKCRGVTTVVAVYCERAVLDDGPDTGLAITYIQDATPNVLQLLAEEGVRRAESKTAGLAYWSNTCEHCGALQGDHFLFSEPGAVFFSTDEDGTENLIFEPIPGEVGFNASWSSGALERAFEAWNDA